MQSDQYPTLVRLSGNYGIAGAAVSGILKKFGWNIVSFLYHNHAVNSGKGNSDCYHTLAGVKSAINTTDVIHKHFDERNVTRENLRKLLGQIKVASRSELDNF